MLTHIDIRNLVAIETAGIEFSSGCTAITGETGTGKSILIDAIGLVLGDRVTGHPVRPGSDRADITLTFNISHLPAVHEWLAAHDFDETGDECIVRRILTPDGRSRSTLNGIPLPLSRLRDLAERLVHLHGQHAEQAILEAKVQLLLLDSFGGLLPLASKVSACALAFRTLQTDIAALRSEIEKDAAHAAFQKIQLEELQALKLKQDEFRHLDQKQRELSHADTSLVQMNAALEILSGEESVSSHLSQLLRTITALQSVCKEAVQWREILETVTIHVNDLENSLRTVAENTHGDPEALTIVEERLGILFEMARKHRIPPDELWDFEHALALRCNEQKHGAEHLASLEAEAERIKNTWNENADRLSAERQKAVRRLETEINTLFKELALEHAIFSIMLEPTPGTLSSSGNEQAVFCLRTSPDQPLQPLASIASGGELSRISLALHIASAKMHATPTLIFDEVDTGIGGGTAETVGRLLRQLGETHQVLCVTHTPQVAAQSHHHVRVQKQIQQETVRIDIRRLSAEERVNEIARMLGGIEITRKTLAHAEEMTEKARLAATQ